MKHGSIRNYIYNSDPSGGPLYVVRELEIKRKRYKVVTVDSLYKKKDPGKRSFREKFLTFNIVYYVKRLVNRVSGHIKKSKEKEK